MSRSEPNPVVRPLSDGQSPTPPPNRPPGPMLVTVLLVAGVLAGWLGASLGSGNPEPGPTGDDDSTLGVASEGTGNAPDVSWTRATNIPAIPTGLEYAGVAGVAELDGHKYVVLNWLDPESGHRVPWLWSSDDGLEWESRVIDLGEGADVYEVATTGSSLLIAGRTDQTDKLWQSVPFRARFDLLWQEIPLDIPEGFETDVIRTAVSSENELVVAMAGHLDIATDLVTQYLPPEMDTGDDSYTYDGGSFIVSGLPRTSTRIFGERPEVAIGGDRVFVRLVTPEGQEFLHTVSLPAGAIAATGSPTLTNVPLTMAWTAPDGSDLLPVVGAANLPRGSFIPEPWQDGFTAASFDLGGSLATRGVELWESESGLDWHLAELQPPQQCASFSQQVSRSRIYLRSEEGVHCVRDVNGPWQLLPETSTAAYVASGPAGFIAYPSDFQYDVAQFSADGMNWSEVEIPGLGPYPILSVLDEQLLVISVDRRRPSSPVQIELWLGNPTSR